MGRHVAATPQDPAAEHGRPGPDRTRSRFIEARRTAA
ncbi:hypothetical protein FHR36_004214 [Kitasatospora paracochleata]|uniref:Uncharacterized protein n=1 Tax=Kitasatospora paracochleata TaxID=58354 RepID=A0ABT1J2T8_9ACTN|nr:hypothetical protein [Kitasatospora paracochleata]